MFDADDQDGDNSEKQESRQEPDPILQMKNRFRSNEVGKSGIFSTQLYPNRWAFSIKNEDSGNW
jgi:hypothetical protein